MEITFLTDDLIVPRRQLLQTCLRPGFDDYTIDREYPIVLDPHQHKYSVCAYEPRTGGDKHLVGHVNHWPRVLQTASDERVRVGLIGNVATAPTHRGQGVMKQMFQYLWQNALDSGLDALILWSNLVEFYHKLGFVACGEELRYYFSAESLQAARPLFSHYCVEVHRGPALQDADLQAMMGLRCPTKASLQRSIEEFRLLLSIPDMLVLTAYSG